MARTVTERSPAPLEQRVQRLGLADREPVRLVELGITGLTAIAASQKWRIICMPPA